MFSVKMISVKGIGDCDLGKSLCDRSGGKPSIEAGPVLSTRENFRSQCCKRIKLHRASHRRLWRTPIVARQRELRLPRRFQLGDQRLINGNVTTSKSVRRAGNIETPYAIRGFIDEAECFIMVRFQSTKPMVQMERIMLAQVFHIADFK